LTNNLEQSKVILVLFKVPTQWQMGVVNIGKILYYYSQAFSWLADEKSFAKMYFPNTSATNERAFLAPGKLKKPPEL